MKLLKIFFISLILFISCSKKSTDPVIVELSAPSNLFVEERGMHAIHLSWIDNSTNELGFIIERSQEDSLNFTILDTLEKNTIAYMDTGLTTGKIYYYRVNTFNSEKVSEYSNIVGTMTLISTISFTPDSTILPINNESGINIIMDNFETTMFGISLRINYDSTLVSFTDSTGFSPGNIFDPNAIVFTKAENSIIYLSLTQVQGQSQVFGTGTLGTLTFKGKSTGNCTIQIIQDKLNLYDNLGSQIELPEMEFEIAVIQVQ